MKNLFVFLAVFLFTMLFFIGCKKDSVDTQKPVVKINSPAWGDSFPDGDSVTVTATISDNSDLGEVHFEVTNKANSAEIVHLHLFPNSKTYDLTEGFSVHSGITYHIVVEGDDKSGNAAEDVIEISGN